MISAFSAGNNSNSMNIGIRIAAGMTTGALAVMFAQPTDVVKIRMQAGNNNGSSVRYNSTLQAYKNIAVTEGVKGLWKGKKNLRFVRSRKRERERELQSAVSSKRQ